MHPALNSESVRTPLSPVLRDVTSRPAPRRAGRAVFLVVLSCLLVLPAHATQVRRLTLEELVEHAETVFAGRCVARRVEDDPGVGGPVTVLTFQVDRAVKGQPGESITFRQIGGRDKNDARGKLIAGLPRFRPGEEVVLFLYGESRVGLRSPVGLGQGKFSIVTDKQGRRLVVNEFGNARLLEGLSGVAQGRLDARFARWRRESLMAPARLLDMVETLVTAVSPDTPRRGGGGAGTESPHRRERESSP